MTGRVIVEREGEDVVMHVQADVPLTPGGTERPVTVRMNLEAASALADRLIDAMVDARRVGG